MHEMQQGAPSESGDFLPLAAKRILEGMGAGLLAFDGEDRVAYVDPPACLLLNCVPEELLGVPVRKILPEALFTSPSTPAGPSNAVELQQGDRLLMLRRLQPVQGYTMIVLHEAASETEEIARLRAECTALRQQVDEATGASRLVSVCSRCGRVRLPDRGWVLLDSHPEELHGRGGLTHGYCPVCGEEFLASLRKR